MGGNLHLVMNEQKYSRTILVGMIIGSLLIAVSGGILPTPFIHAQEQSDQLSSQPEDSPQPAPSEPQPATEVPVFMNGDAFKTDMKNGIYHWTGNARFIRGDDSVFCDELMVYMTPDRQVEKAIATGNVRILTQDVTATSEKGTFYLDEQKVELEGRAKAAQGNNTITASRIIAWLERSAIEGYGSKETERVIMTIYAEPVKQETADQPDQPAADAEPQQPSLIVIESDTLNYDESQEYSTFTGDVHATQNGMDIQADEMRVYLADAQNAESNDIDRIDVIGKVRIVQDALVITGAEGMFMNSEQTAVITGTEPQARAENAAEKSILNADTITILLESDDIQANGNVSVEMMLSEPAEETNP
jgi:lipopolysaccharide transport protein LptA